MIGLDEMLCFQPFVERGDLLVEPSKGRRRIYLARHFTPLVEAKVRERYEVIRNASDRILNAEELAREAVGCEYLFVSATETISSVVFERLANSLRAVATLS